MQKIQQNEFNSIMKNMGIALQQRLALAVSGGADSMCLALLTQRWLASIEPPVDLIVIIIDHGLREESASEALQTADFLQTQGLDAIICKWTKNIKPQSNIQHHARNARYKILTDKCTELGIKNLLIAHNKNDQAETVLIRMHRGSGVKGLCGMDEISEYEDIKIFRPLLKFERDRIEATLKAENWNTWINDPSNTSPKYLRTRMRTLINTQPDKQIWLDRLNLLAQNMQRAETYMEKMTNLALKECAFFRATVISEN